MEVKVVIKMIKHTIKANSCSSKRTGWNLYYPDCQGAMPGLHFQFGIKIVQLFFYFLQKYISNKCAALKKVCHVQFITLRHTIFRRKSSWL